LPGAAGFWRASLQKCTTLADFGLNRSVPEVEPEVTSAAIDVHAAFSKKVAANQNVIGRELIEHGKVADELNPILKPN
jgi:hypothetical protein